MLLGIALGGQRVAKPLRVHALRFAAALGAVVAAQRSALVFNVDTKLQTSLPDWTNFLQEHTENTRVRDATSSTSSKFAEPAQTPGRDASRLRRRHPSLDGGGTGSTRSR